MYRYDQTIPRRLRAMYRKLRACDPGCWGREPGGRRAQKAEASVGDGEWSGSEAWVMGSWVEPPLAQPVPRWFYSLPAYLPQPRQQAVGKGWWGGCVRAGFGRSPTALSPTTSSRRPPSRMDVDIR